MSYQPLREMHDAGKGQRVLGVLSQVGSHQRVRRIATAAVTLLLIALLTTFVPANPEDTSGTWASRISTASWRSKWLGKGSGVASLNPVHNATLGFGALFAIVLAKRKDRIQELKWAATATNLNLTFFDGVYDADVPRAEEPDTWRVRGHATGQLGSLTSHVRVWKYVVEHNLTSAMIVESDGDWDMRVKESMQGFAEGVRSLIDWNWPPAVHTIGGGSKTSRQRLIGDNALTYGAAPSDMSDDTFSSEFHSSTPSDFESDPLAYHPDHPYGHHWDMLHMGSCGSFTKNDGRFYVYADPAAKPSNMTTPWNDNLNHKLFPRPGSTRLVYQPRITGCSAGYAISNRGARKFIEILKRRANVAADMTMQEACKLPGYTCVTVHPPIVAQADSKSNIGADLVVDASKSKIPAGKEIQMSARVNGQAGIRVGLESPVDYIKEYEMPGYDY